MTLLNMTIMKVKNSLIQQQLALLIPLILLLCACASPASAPPDSTVWCTYTITWKDGVTEDQKNQDRQQLQQSLSQAMPEGFIPKFDWSGDSSNLSLSTASSDTTIHKPPPGTRPPAGRVTFGTVQVNCP